MATQRATGSGFGKATPARIIAAVLLAAATARANELSSPLMRGAAQAPAADSVSALELGSLESKDVALERRAASVEKEEGGSDEKAFVESRYEAIKTDGHEKEVAEREVEKAGREGAKQEGEHGEESEKEEEEEKEEEKEKEKEEEEEKEEAEFSAVDLAIALMLLGFITFVMCLFTLVNHEDDDMRFYAWWVVSNTLSIFVAVLMFSSINSLFHNCLFTNYPPWVHILIDLLEQCFYLVTMQWCTAYYSGVFEERPFKEKTSATDADVRSQKDQKERRMKCWATLFAHMTGFAAINFGGSMQHGEFFRSHPLLTFAVVPVMYGAHILVGRLFRMMRDNLIHNTGDPSDSPHNHKAHEFEFEWDEPAERLKAEEFLLGVKGGKLYVKHKYETEVTEAMNDVASLCVSFLTVQACRFNVSGVLPDNLGIEEENYKHPFMCSVILGCMSLGFAVLSMIFVWIHSWEFFKGAKPGTSKNLLKRAVGVSKTASAMSMAWCLLYVFKWEVARSSFEVNPNKIVARVCMAVVVSFFAFAVISVLDKVADADSTGDLADEAIIQIINAISILVGFSWEQAFDGGVEVLGEKTPNPVTFELLLAIFVAWVVISPWRRYILQKVIHLEEEQEKKKRVTLNIVREEEDEVQKTLNGKE